MDQVTQSHDLLIILGNQLFPIEEIRKTECRRIFMAEDLGICTEHRHHRLKIYMFFSAMRSFRDSLREEGFEVLYRSIEDPDFRSPYLKKIENVISRLKIKKVKYFEIEDHFFESQIEDFLASSDCVSEKFESPMFLCSREKFGDFAANKKKLRMASFYQLMRTDLSILVDSENKPVGGRWSFDEENRKKLPKDIKLPERPAVKRKENLALKELIIKTFPDHPGSIENAWMPTSRPEALAWLDNFLTERFTLFGTYEDAIHAENQFLFHSALSPVMNMGILTPREVIDRALAYGEGNSIPINSLEGFIRQIIGWREFIRGVYHEKGDDQSSSNFWNHKFRLTEHWYDGSTGIPPLDDAIFSCIRYGYTHHIPRLMVIANLMTLCRIHPDEIYRWFMEMFVDSSDWVMVPNVYGMGTFSDAGIFATKPYLCGSNYLLKMSNYKRGQWCDIVDGLYWKFMHDHLEFFKSNPRLAVMPRALNKLNPERRHYIFSQAEMFIENFTQV